MLGIFEGTSIGRHCTSDDTDFHTVNRKASAARKRKFLNVDRGNVRDLSGCVMVARSWHSMWNVSLNCALNSCSFGMGFKNG